MNATLHTPVGKLRTATSRRYVVVQVGAERAHVVYRTDDLSRARKRRVYIGGLIYDTVTSECLTGAAR